MHGATKHLRLRFDDDFNDYPESINVRTPKIASPALTPAPKPFFTMTRRSKRRQRQNQRRAAAARASDAAMNIFGEDGVATRDGDALFGLQHGDDDPIGFRTIQEGYNPMEDFHLFPKLPLEMRREVWHHVLPEAQSIFISSNGHIQFVYHSNVRKSSWVYRPQVTYKVPHLLSVCRETRQEVKIFNPPAFAAQFGGVPIYYNPKIDLLHFSSPETLIHFYGGSIPNFLPRSFTNGFRWNMSEFHKMVPQIAIGQVEAWEGIIGAVLNQMKGLKVVMLENMLKRPEGENIIKSYCYGINDLAMGWRDYTKEYPEDRRAKFKFVRSQEFKERILGWRGRIISEEEEAAEKAAVEEAKALAAIALAREQEQQQ